MQGMTVDVAGQDTDRQVRASWGNPSSPWEAQAHHPKEGAGSCDGEDPEAAPVKRQRQRDERNQRQYDNPPRGEYRNGSEPGSISVESEKKPSRDDLGRVNPTEPSDDAAVAAWPFGGRASRFIFFHNDVPKMVEGLAAIRCSRFTRPHFSTPIFRIGDRSGGVHAAILGFKTRGAREVQR
jgi:hypothetical protein